MLVKLNSITKKSLPEAKVSRRFPTRKSPPHDGTSIGITQCKHDHYSIQMLIENGFGSSDD